ncbi:hypothetical protein HS088_TW20G00334 [Tripterygium wilfordii]|uniref:Protein unc-13 homolog n=1 Tax=Tripterygium wilfordii TaxID=458696 RepID=A0A7J7C7N8_TRIWF|nr:protein unc-13 homolog [Tripterygium wilfordii]KAF5729965.1 hypothetical protein HS088_TW20G00334 [Tripterygium wilfordii]
MEQTRLLERYRRDRRKLLEFLLSSGLINEVRNPSSSTASSVSDIDVDSLSADYLLHCITSGGVLNISEVAKKDSVESPYPIMIHSQHGNSYFLLSDPDSAGSPPRRVPPSVNVSRTNIHSVISPTELESLNACRATTSRDENGPKSKGVTTAAVRPAESSVIPTLGLPRLKTGLSDDDLRESAYELLLASVYFTGIEVCSVEDTKKDKSSKFLSGLKSKRGKHSQSQASERHLELIDTICVQMQISDAMDTCTRRNLMQLAARKMTGQIDLPHISLGLLNGIFKSDFPNEKSYMQWMNRQANILEELLCCPGSLTASEDLTIRSCLAKIRDANEWDTAMSPFERVAAIASIKQVAIKLSSLPGEYGVQGETYYWTAGYPLNIRIYEKLLFIVFDVLDEGEIIEEADEVLSFVKLNWCTLGITQKMHDALYGWVLFQQFVGTEEGMLLEYAVTEVAKVLLAEKDSEKEAQYMKSLVCFRECKGSALKLSLVHAVFLSIGIWCDGTLNDYHQYFGQKPGTFKRLMDLVSAVGIPISVESGEIKLSRLNDLTDDAARKLSTYVEKSIEAAYRRVVSALALESQVEKTHYLALLANGVRQIAEREFSAFSPVLRQWCPESLMISVTLLHQFYGDTLKSFLRRVSSFSEDVRLVLSAADSLDHYLTQLYVSSSEENTLSHPFKRNLSHYQIGEVCGPMILDWLIAQHDHILEWTGRAFDLEGWEPLSNQKKYASSIIEVFRIIEETVDQLFGFDLPLNITHLQALLSVIFHSLDAYLLRVRRQLVEKNNLYPPIPPLTRYEETVLPIIKKKLLESMLLEDGVKLKLNELTIPKLCIRLNTLQYIQKQIGVLEDGIRKSWAQVRPSLDPKQDQILEMDFLTHGEAMEELFITTFHSIRDTAACAVSKICDFTGTRFVFWDMRDTLLFHVYRGNVETARLDIAIPHIDRVLDHICCLVDDDLRDSVVLSIYKATLEGFVWVLLNGGPSRAFSDSDIRVVEDDLDNLKEFFIADGEGLPRSLVEKEAKSAKQILSLFSLETEIVIRMLMNASEHISTGTDLQNYDHTHLEDAHTLIRVLCHKRDKEASRFLRRKYQLPMSSEYDDTLGERSLRSSAVSDLLKQSTSFQWTKNGHTSFKSIKQKFHEATSDFRNVTW